MEIILPTWAFVWLLVLSLAVALAFVYATARTWRAAHQKRSDVLAYRLGVLLLARIQDKALALLSKQTGYVYTRRDLDWLYELERDHTSLRGCQWRVALGQAEAEFMTNAAAVLAKKVRK
jgi:hypothetical protein